MRYEIDELNEIAPSWAEPGGGIAVGRYLELAKRVASMTVSSSLTPEPGGESEEVLIVDGHVAEELPFPALANVCRECQPPSIGWMPDPGEPRFEADLEYRTGPACRMCGGRERWRKGTSGAWVCRVCHPPAL